MVTLLVGDFECILHSAETRDCCGRSNDLSGSEALEVQHPNLLVLLGVGATAVGAGGLADGYDARIKRRKLECGTFVGLVFHGEEVVVCAVTVKVNSSAGLGGRLAGSGEVASEIFEVCDGLACNLGNGHNGLRTVIASHDDITIIVDDDVAARNGGDLFVAGGVSTASDELARNLAFGLLCGDRLEGAGTALALGHRVSPGTCVLGEVAFDDRARRSKRCCIECCCRDEGLVASEDSGLFALLVYVTRLLTQTPVAVRDVVLVHELSPFVRSACVRFTVAVSVCGTPFRDEHRVAGIESACNVATVAALGVARGVEVQNVGDVSRCDRALCALFRMLRPVRRTDDDQVLGVGTDARNNLVCVVLDGVPVSTATADRFVVNFVNDVRHVLVLQGNLLEKVLGDGCFLVSSVAMPVDNDIDVVFNSRLDHLVDHGQLAFRVGLVTTIHGVLGAAIAIVVFNAHGKTEHVNFEVVYDP